MSSRVRRFALAAGVVLALGLFGVGVLVVRWALSPARTQAAPVVFEVARGATLASIARDLERVGLVRSRHAVEWLARVRGQSESLMAGEYELSATRPADEILDILASGRVRTYEVVLPEGITAAEVAQRLQTAGLAAAEEFLAFASNPGSAARLGVSGASLEGYLFPDTYRMPRNLPPQEIARTLVAQFLRVWSELERDAGEQQFTMLEVATLASIVEKETSAPQERPLIASVFRNRLARDMRLESDPTVIYGIPGFDGNLRRAHLEDESNPYNTYKIAGLPPGPIANAGADSLRAVLNSAESDYLFFVSRNDGTHVFSRSYGEHVNAVNRYQKRRRR